MTEDRIAALRDFHRERLLEDVVPFWSRHGIDREQGGFFTCLDRTGQVYSTDKPVWFMGRTTWLFAALHRTVAQDKGWLDTAMHGMRFMIDRCFADSGKMYFLLDRAGQPLRMRRYYASELYAVVAFIELARATGDPSIRDRAMALVATLRRVFEEPGMVEPKVNPTTRPTMGLSPLMSMLNVLEPLVALAPSPELEQTITSLIDPIFKHFVKPEDGLVLEVVAPDGSRLDAPEGRAMNPGQVAATSWFLMEIARRRSDAALAKRSADFLADALELGWDTEYGGLLHIIDIEGKPSPYIEHDNKLWWPHCEALYATLLAYHMTGEQRFADWYERVHEWTFDHFPDPEYGEWFGYLRRDGAVSNTLKGGIWKGPFHLPRCLLNCWRLLEEMANRS